MVENINYLEKGDKMKNKIFWIARCLKANYYCIDSKKLKLDRTGEYWSTNHGWICLNDNNFFTIANFHLNPGEQKKVKLVEVK